MVCRPPGRQLWRWLRLGFWACLADSPPCFAAQAVEDLLQSSPEALSIDPFALCNLCDGQSVDPERTEPAAMVRLQVLQHLDQPVALWISLLLPVVLKAVDPGFGFSRPIAMAALVME